MYRIMICTAICFLVALLAQGDEASSVWQGKVVDANGKPIAEANVCIGGNAKRLAETKTDAEGNFRFASPKNADTQFLYAFKNGAGFDYIPLKGEAAPKDSYTLTFQGLNSVRIRFVDQDDKPIAGRGLTAWLLFNKDKQQEFNTSLAAEYQGLFAQSDEQGYVHIASLPAGFQIVFQELPKDESGKISQQAFFSDPYWHPARDIYYDQENPKEEIVVKLAPTVRISGTVRFEDNRSVSGVRMSLLGRGFMPCDIPCNPGRTRADFERMGCLTDKNGRYSMTLFGDMLYIFGPLSKQIDGKWYGAAPARDVVSKIGTTLENIDFVYKPFTGVSGQILKKDGTPLAKASLGFFRYGIRSDELPPEKRLENKSGIEGYVHHPFLNLFQAPHIVVTDDEGRFEISLPPGLQTAVYSWKETQHDEWRDLRTSETAVKPLFEFTLDGEEKKDLGAITLKE